MIGIILVDLESVCIGKLIYFKVLYWYVVVVILDIEMFVYLYKGVIGVIFLFCIIRMFR